MATLLLYADAVGERSSRTIERRCRERVGFRVAACSLQPDHVTIVQLLDLPGIGEVAVSRRAALPRQGKAERETPSTRQSSELGTWASPAAI